MPVTLDAIRAARARIAGMVLRTPLVRAAAAGWPGPAELWLKLDLLQPTGSFKLRGAAARLTALSAGARARGVLAVSAGNHGLAVAHVAGRLGIPATVVVPRGAAPAKVEALRRQAVCLVQEGDSYDEAERLARARAAAAGQVFVSPYNDAGVIAGQGTIGLELAEDDPGLDAVVVPVGGGGLIAGVAVALRALAPRVAVYGAEPAATPTMTRALAAGRIVPIVEEPTLADGLAGNIEAGAITFPLVQRLVDGMIVVGEPAIRRATLRLARDEHLIVEGSAAVALAALADSRLAGRRVAVVLTGRNLGLDRLVELAREG